MGDKFNIIGLGEILWDILPDGKKLGGAPSNFIYHVSSLEHNGIIFSRIGDDDLGKEIISNLHHKGLDTKYIQIDQIHPTGTVDVQFDKDNQPDYIINEKVAWDFLIWDDVYPKLLKSVDAICFGTLAQRHNITRKTILKILDNCGKNALKVLDINLRQDFYSKQIIEESLRLANILKLNDSELKVISKVLKMKKTDNEEASCLYLLKKFGLKLVCLTKGDQGSILVDERSVHRQEAYPCKVADTVGAGDAFTAAMIIQYLKGSPLKIISEISNRLASWTASKKGAMPAYDDIDL